MRRIVAVAVLLAVSLALAGPVLAQELRVLENIEQSLPPTRAGNQPPITLEIPPAPMFHSVGGKDVR